MSLKTIASAVDNIAAKSPNRLALLSPFQDQVYTYQEISEKSNRLAAWLHRYGYAQKDLLVSDLPNTSENLLLQLACNRLGVGFGTAKSLENLSKFPKVKGACVASGTGFLAETSLPLPYLSGEFLVDLIKDGANEETAMLDILDEGEDSPLLDCGDLATSHGFYNTTVAYSNEQALQQGQEAARELTISENDRVCISITLCHPFGIGSGVCSTLMSGATIVLPAVGGIQGCGVPSERAAATLDTLENENCSLLFCDTHTLRALPVDCSLPSLRGGVCKTGSGSTFLDEKLPFGGTKLRTIGKKV